VTGYRLDDRVSRVRLPVGAGNFSLHHRVQNGSVAHPASYTMDVPGALSLGYSGRGVKLTTHLHLVPRSKNEWSYTSIPQYVFVTRCLVNHRDKFTYPYITSEETLIRNFHDDDVLWVSLITLREELGGDKVKSRT
jgi:hypothetical protein